MNLMQITPTFMIDINEVAGVSLKDKLRLRLKDGTEKHVDEAYVELVMLRLGVYDIATSTSHDLDVLKRIDTFRDWFIENAGASNTVIGEKMLELLSVVPKMNEMRGHDFEIFRDEGAFYLLMCDVGGRYDSFWELTRYDIFDDKKDRETSVKITQKDDGWAVDVMRGKSVRALTTHLNQKLTYKSRLRL